MFVISLYNLKGGVGKTTSCVNFAYMASKDGYKTLLWDIDPQGASSFYFKAVPIIKGSSKKIIEKTIAIKSAIVPTNYTGLDIIPADISARKLDILLEENSGAQKQLKSILKDLSSIYDFIFIDCPPGVSTVANNIFYVSDAVLMPVVPTMLSKRTYDQIKAYFIDKEIELGKLMCFFSMVEIRKKMHNDIMHLLYQEKNFFEHYIPYLSDIEKMGIKNAPVEVFAPLSFACQSYRALWNNIKEGILD